MTEGLFDRYFRLLAGQLPAAEYGVIAEPTEENNAMSVNTESQPPECLC
jgi:hypothetical protein